MAAEHFLREWRVRRGWSQEELGEKVGVAHNTIGRWETGEADIKSKHLKKLAVIFGVPRWAILDLDPSDNQGSKTAKVIEAFERIAPEHQTGAIAQIEAFAASFPAAVGTKKPE